jgi:proteasome assembly chaperone (PAC2) family protein
MSRRYYRVTYNRSDSNEIFSEVLLKEVYRNQNGTVITKNDFMVILGDDQVKGITGHNTYFGRVIDLCNDMKDEWNVSGSNATGSVVQLNSF